MRPLTLLFYLLLIVKVHAGNLVRGWELLYLYSAYRVDYEINGNSATLASDCYHVDQNGQRSKPGDFHDFATSMQDALSHYNSAIGSQKIQDPFDPTLKEVRDLAYWDGAYPAGQFPKEKKAGNPKKEWEKEITCWSGYLGYDADKYLGAEKEEQWFKDAKAKIPVDLTGSSKHPEIHQIDLFQGLADKMEGLLAKASNNNKAEVLRLVNVAQRYAHKSHLGRRADSAGMNLARIKATLNQRRIPNAPQVLTKAIPGLGFADKKGKKIPVLEADLEATLRSIPAKSPVVLKKTKEAFETWLENDVKSAEDLERRKKSNKPTINAMDGHTRLEKSLGDISSQLERAHACHS